MKPNLANYNTTADVTEMVVVCLVELDGVPMKHSWWKLQTDQLPHFCQLLDNTSSLEEQLYYLMNGERTVG